VGRLRLSRAAVALLGSIAGAAMFTAGVAWKWGPAVGLIVAGIIVAGSFLLLTDVDEGDGGEPDPGRPPSL
jgi:hypothetical protein